MNTDIKATVEEGELVIKIPLYKTPYKMKGGKTKIIASSLGFKETKAYFEDKPVFININAHIKR